MPDSVAYQPDLMDRIFTQKRMYSYQRVFGRLTDREMVGIYIWNQTLGGELYPLLSAAEITLRNAIDSAFIAFAGPRWWRGVKYKSYAPVAGHVPPFEVKAMKENFVRAADYARKEKYFRYHKPNHAPTHEEVVASTDFSTWQFAMSDELNRPGFPGECFICELRLPDHRFRWKHNKLFLLLPEEYGPAFPAIVDCYTSPPT